YDGTIEHFERNLRNNLYTHQTPAGINTIYGYSSPGGNLQAVTRNPAPGSNQNPILQSAIYPQTCTNIITCNKPTSTTDANGNIANFTYDPVHGGTMTVTGPAVNGIQPQTRYTYVQRYAWYLASSGVMTRETHPIWLRTSESYCRS